MLKKFLHYSIAISLVTGVFIPINNDKSLGNNISHYGTTVDRDCSVSLGENGETIHLSQWDVIGQKMGYKSGNKIYINTLPRVINTGGAYSFVRRTGTGNCTYEFFNGFSFGGKKRIVGANLQDRLRLGWRARSLIITYHPNNNNNCHIKLGGGGNTETHRGRGLKLSSVNKWDFVRETSGNCTFRVYNGYNFKGRYKDYKGGINQRIRVGWRIRSLEIF